MIIAQDILHFWFQELTPADQFTKNPQVDQKIRQRFLPTWEKAIRGELFQWRNEAQGRLAEIIVLDQFSRNMFRDQAQAFAGDPMALILAQEMVAGQWDQKIPVTQRAFIYMPYMHSESLVIHDEASRLFAQDGLQDNLKYEGMHRKIIERFGRYPHRNRALGRASTPEEIEFLKQPGSSF